MWNIIFVISLLLTQNCLGIYLVDLPLDKLGNVQPSETEDSEESYETVLTRRLMSRSYPPVKNDYYKFRQSQDQPMAEDDKDLDIKNKIKTLVQQSVHDTERKIKSIQNLKNKHREKAPYKIGFILSMIKKARDVLNELFNVAVKHRDEWKALEQLKIFELIVHTNVDTTNLVRQLVEIHVQYLNASKENTIKKRVVLI